MAFPRDSAFSQAAGIPSREEQEAFNVPVRTPEENRRIADEQAAKRTHVSIPITEYEDWIESLKAASDMRGGEELLDLALEMEVYL